MLCSREPPTESEKVPRVAASLLAASVKKLAGLVDCSGAGSKGCELDEVAAIEREVGDFLGGDDLAEGGIRGFYGDFGWR